MTDISHKNALAQILTIDLEQADAEFTKSAIKMLVAELIDEDIGIDDLLDELKPGWQKVYETMRAIEKAMKGME